MHMNSPTEAHGTTHMNKVESVCVCVSRTGPLGGKLFGTGIVFLLYICAAPHLVGLGPVGATTIQINKMIISITYSKLEQRDWSPISH